MCVITDWLRAACVKQLPRRFHRENKQLSNSRIPCKILNYCIYKNSIYSYFTTTTTDNDDDDDDNDNDDDDDDDNDNKDVTITITIMTTTITTICCRFE